MSSKTPPPQVNPTRLKTAIKMAISKSKFLQEKKTALVKQQRRQLADLLNQGKESSATIRVENIIRDDIYIELLEFIELYCELLLARISIILDINRTSCDSGLIEAVQSVIYAAPHTELKELTTIRDSLIHKYGIEFGKAAIDNTDNHVPEKIVKRCQIDPPSQELVTLYLCEIARAYDAPYSKLKEYEASQEEDEDENEEKEKEKDINEKGDNNNNNNNNNNDNDDDDDSPSGGQKELAEPIAEQQSTKPVSKAKAAQDEFDALKARFAALKSGK
ncbi:regulator of Vps4 activity in the MVB pathway-domain-containing protein [Scheffersomyces amazonensis]|uniref:regulator of Vps4 activity in the MVB pathway-domain-containing protein n=1 Tax=Scheffersomyces amazonensis TaxID=1078765 RepID=UPI00315DF73F